MAFNPFGYSNASSNGFQESPEYQKYRYQYGERDGGSQMEQNDLQAKATEADQRVAPQMQGAQMQGAQLDQQAADGTRSVQMGSLAGLSAAANGAAPSAAENLARQGIDRSLRAQTSAAGNVRGGPGAQASAFRAAAQGAAAQRADMNQGIQASRADEMSNARGQLASASSAVRGQDLTAATTNASLNQDTAKTNAGFNQDTAKTNAGLQQQGTALNDSRAQQYEALRHQTAQDQLNADIAQQKIQSDSREHADTLNTQTNQKNADRTWDVTKGVIGMGQGVASGVAKIFSDPNTKMPVGGSLATLGLGGTSGASIGSHGHGVGGGVELDQSGGISHDDLLAAGSGMGDPNMMHGMVGGGGITGGHVDTGEDGTSTMTSDEDAKTPGFLDQIGRETEGATPYDREPEKGVAGAPKGYAAGRGAPEDDDVSWSKPDTWGSKKPSADAADTSGQAPGTDDWNRYGKSAKDEGEPDWESGGATAKPEGKPGVFQALFSGVADAHPYGTPGTAPAMQPPPAPSKGASGKIGGVLGGLSNARYVGGGDVGLRDTTTSDPAAKRAAYSAGLADGMSKSQGAKTERPKGAGAPLKEHEELYVTKDGEPEIREHGVRYVSPDEVPPDTIAWDMTKDDPFIRTAGSQAKGQGRAIATGENGVSAFATPPPAPAAPAPPTTATDRARAFARDVVRSDERTKDGFEQVSDHTMAKAMRSMDPAVYAYKPEYSPPDQKPGEVNIGPMANAMAKDPVARTAIVRDADSGMLAIDKTKAEKVMMGSLAALQHQVDELKGDVPRADRAKKQRPNGRAANA